MANFHNYSSVYRTTVKLRARFIHLTGESELQIAIDEDTTDVILELIKGTAEIFGSELEKNKVYNLPSASYIALYTWQGCSVKLNGKVNLIVTKDTKMIIPVNFHACIQSMRLKAGVENVKGPVSLIVGPADVGKTSFCRLLLNYAARMGKRPLFIDLDVGQSSASIPGTICILPVEKQSDIVEGFDKQTVSVFPFGYESPQQNIALYFLLIKKLGQLIQNRLENANPNTRTSGIIIDTSGWTSGAGYQAITLAASAFEIDILFVMEDEELYPQLKRDMPGSVHVAYVPRQYGVMDKSEMVRLKKRESRVKEYFYGIRGDLSPHSIDIPFDEIQIYKVKPTSPNIIVPDIVDVEHIGFEDIDMTSVIIGPGILNQVLGLSFADDVDENMFVTNVMGFVCVSKVDMESKILTLLSPQPGPLPTKICLMGDIKMVRPI